jgi:hypothetical protein
MLCRDGAWLCTLHGSCEGKHIFSLFSLTFKALASICLCYAKNHPPQITN